MLHTATVHRGGLHHACSDFQGMLQIIQSMLHSPFKF